MASKSPLSHLTTLKPMGKIYNGSQERKNGEALSRVGSCSGHEIGAASASPNKTSPKNSTSSNQNLHSNNMIVSQNSNSSSYFPMASVSYSSEKYPTNSASSTFSFEHPHPRQPHLQQPSLFPHVLSNQQMHPPFIADLTRLPSSSSSSSLHGITYPYPYHFENNSTPSSSAKTSSGTNSVNTAGFLVLHLLCPRVKKTAGFGPFKLNIPLITYFNYDIKI